MAKIQLKGKVIGDPNLSYSAKGNAIIKVRIVENFNKKNDKDEWEQTGAIWYNGIAFGDVAEELNLLPKNAFIEIDGTLKGEYYTLKGSTERKDSTQLFISSFNTVEKTQQSKPKQRDAEYQTDDDLPF